MKKIILILAIFLCSNVAYSKVFYYQDHNYYGVPLHYTAGLGYKRGNFTMAFPYIGAAFTPTDKYGYGLYTGMKFIYAAFEFDARFIYQVATWKEFFQLKYVDGLNYHGSFTVAYSTDMNKVSLQVDVGEMLITNLPLTPLGTFVTIGKDKEQAERVFTIKAKVNAHGVAHDDTISRVAYDLDARFDIIPHLKTSSYHILAYMPINFRLGAGWAQLNFLPGLEYSDFLRKGDKPFILAPTPKIYERFQFLSHHNAPNYQFLATVGTEFRLYMKFFEKVAPPLSRLFLNVFTTLGYGSEQGQQISDGGFVYIYGGGIGYYLFDSAAFVFNVGSDKSNKLFLNVTITSPFEFPLH